MVRILVFICLVFFVIESANAQTTKTIAELEQEKKEAIASEDYKRAAELKQLIDEQKKHLSEQNSKTLFELEVDKKEALANEDYAKASEIKQQIENRSAYLDAELDKAVESEDYNRATLIKDELKLISTPSNSQAVSNDELTGFQKLNQPQKLDFLGGGMHLYWGAVHHAASTTDLGEDFSSYYIPIEIVSFDESRLLAPALLSQMVYQGMSYEISDYYSYSNFMFTGAIGVGVATNFGWRDNNSRFKPFAYSTMGFGFSFNNITEGTPSSLSYGYSYLETETTTDYAFSFNYTLRVGGTFYLGDRFGLSVSMGLNNYSYINIGLAW